MHSFSWTRTQATSRSLVVIDEIGRGTCVADGCGLASAIARHIALKIKCYCYFATHFHELTKLAEPPKGQVATAVTSAAVGMARASTQTMKKNIVRNMFMKAHTTASTITMLYKVSPGTQQLLALCANFLLYFCWLVVHFDFVRACHERCSRCVGVCSDSLGLHCATMAGFPASVLKEAQRWQMSKKQISR